MNLLPPPLRLAGYAAFGLLLGGVRAEPPAEAPAPPSLAAPLGAPARTEAAESPAPGGQRPAPSDTSAMISAGLPKYSPPKPAPPPRPESELPDLRDTDKPRNEIIRLPKYVVRAAKPPIFREQDIHNAQGLADLAVRRYLSEFDRELLNKVTLPLFGSTPEARALEMYREDLRWSNLASLNDTANAMARGGDKSESVYIKREAEDTYMRTIDWGGTIPKP